MRGKEKERWQELSELAANEQDPKKLLELVQEINRLMEAKERRLRGESPNESKPESR
jgi:hypothetical protein